MLRCSGADGERLAASLGSILSPSGPARLLLGAPGAQRWAADTDRLLVLSTKGLALTRPGVDEQDWGLDEQLSLPLMHLAAWLAYRRVYELPRSAPKLVGLDELSWLSKTSTGRTLITSFPGIIVSIGLGCWSRASWPRMCWISVAGVWSGESVS